MAKRGIAVPREYASVIRIAPPFIELVAARVIIEAKIGPTHGVHTSPRESPTKNPAIKSGRLVFIFCCGERDARREKSFSIAI